MNDSPQGLIREAQPTPALESVPGKRARKSAQEKMQQLIRQQEELGEHRKVLEELIQAENRKRKAKLDSIIGAACRADTSIHEAVRLALAKHVHDARVQAFLKGEGWF